MPLFTNVFPNLTVRETAFNTAHPSNHRIVAWAYDPSTIRDEMTIASGDVRITAMYISESVTINTIYWGVATGGSGATAGQNEVGIYNSSGTLLSSANVDASITTAGRKITTIPAAALEAGNFYWTAIVLNATTRPNLHWPVPRGGFGGVQNVGQSTALQRMAQMATGQTSLPASFNPATLVEATSPWMAIDDST